MNAQPVALLTRTGASALIAKRADPCVGCDYYPSCLLYPCPHFGPEDFEEIAAEAAKEETVPITAMIMAPGADWPRRRSFDSLDELVAYSVANPRHVVGDETDPDHAYVGGVRRDTAPAK